MYRATLTRESTPKEVYDHIMAALDADSFPSYGLCRKFGFNSCAYRAEKVKACAFGIFIPDELYNDAMEGINAMSVIDILGESNKFPSFFFVSNGDLENPFINRLQGVHDALVHEWNPKKFKTEVRKLFREFNLQID